MRIDIYSEGNLGSFSGDFSTLFFTFLFMKTGMILGLLATLTFLASCTHTVNPVSAPVIPKALEETKMMKDDTMKKDTMMNTGTMMEESMETKMMDEKKMMSGSKTEWTKEEMEAMEKDHMMMSGSDMKMNDTIKKDDNTKMMKPTGYMNYDEAKVKAALADGQKVVLFFHAAWCPTCRALESAINSDLASIPADTIIVKVDYDTSDAMKRKYGVTSQHTTVRIDQNMALVSKKLGARSVSDILN